jgi:hypothetical protein
VLPSLTVATSGADLRGPNLVSVDPTNGTSCVVYSRRSASPPAPAITQVGCFDAWGAWPPETPIGVDAHQEHGDQPVPGDSIVATSRIAPPAGSFALVFGDATGTHTYFSPATGYGAASTPWTFGIDSGVPLFLASAATFGNGSSATQAVLAGISLGEGQGAQRLPYPSLSLALVSTTEEENLFSVMCATTPIAADAVGIGRGWLIGAAHSGAAVLTSGCRGGGAGMGPATTLDFGTLSLQTAWSPVARPLATTAPVTRLRMSPRSDGAWAVYHVDGSPRLEGARVVPATQVVETFAIEIAPSAVNTFQVMPLGDAFVLGTTSSAGGGMDEIRLDHFDAGGAITWSTTLSVAGAVDGAVSLLPSGDASAFLVAWSELPTPTSERRLRIARFDCRPEP